MEQSIHPPQAAAERAALRSARSSARAHGSSGSAGCGAERLPTFTPRKKKELRTTWSRASIRHRRQQSVPHSGVREALLAPMAAPALPDEVRSVLKSKITEDRGWSRERRQEPAAEDFISSKQVKLERYIATNPRFQLLAPSCFERRTYKASLDDCQLQPAACRSGNAGL
jgi:hypothetical protein